MLMKPPPTNLYHRIVWPLAIAETIVWAAMYYSFPALLLEWERDLGWTKTELAGAFTLALVVSALSAPLVGRMIDRGSGRRIFTSSALLGAVCLAILSTVTTRWQFYAVWIVIGLAMAGSLYEACFAILTKTMGGQRKQAITLVTLVAGFAGTVSFSSTHTLVGLVGWRGTVLILAATVTLIAIPLIWLGCRTAEAYEAPPLLAANQPTTDISSLVYSPVFWLLALGFSAIALNHGVLLTHLLPLLDERGVPSGTAVFAASMIGPMQVTGRLAMLAVEKRLSSLGIFYACFVAMGIASVSLLAAGSVTMLILSFVLFQGAGYGVTSILRPIVIADLLGRQNFGSIAGFLAVPFMAAAAAAPTVAALIWGVGGYDLVIWTAIGAVGVGLLSLLAAANLAARRPSNAPVIH